jgi:hypothetical protein
VGAGEEVATALMLEIAAPQLRRVMITLGSGILADIGGFCPGPDPPVRNVYGGVYGLACLASPIGGITAFDQPGRLGLTREDLHIT